MKSASWMIVGAIALFGVVQWQNSATAQGRLSPPFALASATLSPFQNVLNAAGGYFSNLGHALMGGGDLQRENTRLRMQLADLEGQNARLGRYRRENEELRGLLKMPPLPNGNNLAAQIVATSQSEIARRLTLNIGSRSGVAMGDVVYCAQGVVGQITSVGLLTSVATPFIDRMGAVGAMVPRSGAQGVVLGNGNRVAKLSYLAFDADVREGDTLLSSGLTQGQGGIFPRGLVIGRVLKVEKDKAYSRQEAYVEPSVPFDELTAVWVRVADNNAVGSTP